MDQPDPAPIGAALHDRVRDEHPDLDRLVRRATRAGARQRRRRRAGVSIVAAVGVTAVAVLGSQLAGGPGGTTGDGPGVAGRPSAASSGSTSASPAPDGPLVRLDRVSALAAVRLRTLEQLAREVRARERAVRAPVRVELAGWACDPPADEKLVCANGGSEVVVTYRPARHHDDYLGPGKAGGQTFVSEVHGRWFATVTGGPGATQADVDAVGAALVWR